MQSVQLVVDMSAGMLASLASISLFTPVFLLPGIVAAVIGTLLGNVYLKAQLSMSREVRWAILLILYHSWFIS